MELESQRLAGCTVQLHVYGNVLEIGVRPLKVWKKAAVERARMRTIRPNETCWSLVHTANIMEMESLAKWKR